MLKISGYCLLIVSSIHSDILTQEKVITGTIMVHILKGSNNLLNHQILYAKIIDMAQQRRRTTSNNTRQRSSGTRKSSNGRAPAKRQSVQTSDVTFADYWLAFSKSRAFFPIMTISTITLIILIDLLISWNNYDRFFIMLGIELILAAVIWIAGLVLSLGKDSVSDEGGAE